jgi:hypothetical protein
MIGPTLLPGVLFVDRALAAFAQRIAESGLLFRCGIKAQKAFNATFGIIQGKRVRARS